MSNDSSNQNKDPHYGPTDEYQITAPNTGKSRLSPNELHHLTKPRLAEDSRDALARASSRDHLSSREVILREGAQIGEYIIEAPLAAGAMGEVWRGSHPVIGKRVAIKVLGQDILVNKEAIARFIQEARAVNEIRHRNIIDIFAFGDLADGRPYLVMELLEGVPLSGYIDEKKRLPFSMIVTLLDQICRALGAAHEQSIVHRDLKPENIFLVLERRAPPFVKLLDFGLAKLLGDQSTGRKDLTRPGAVYGTPAYMSPEQCMAAGKVDHVTDIYSLGAIVFEMICGRVPYPFVEAEGVGMLMVKHMTAPIPVCSEAASDRKIPPALDAFFSKALAKKKEERHQNCEVFYDEFMAAIGSLKSEESIPAPPLIAETVTLPPEPPEQKLSPPEDDDATEFAPTQIGPIPEGASAPAPQTHAWPQDQAPQEDPSDGEEKPRIRAPIIAIASVSLIVVGVAALLLWPDSTPKKDPPKASPASVVIASSTPASTSAPVSTPAIQVQTNVMLRVSSTPKGAKVYLGEKLLGLTPLAKEIPRGDAEVQLRIEKLGFETEAITLIPNSERKEDIKLTPLKIGTPPKNNPKIEPPPKDGSKITINPFGQKK